FLSVGDGAPGAAGEAEALGGVEVEEVPPGGGAEPGVLPAPPAGAIALWVGDAALPGAGGMSARPPGMGGAGVRPAVPADGTPSVPGAGAKPPGNPVNAPAGTPN